MKFRVTRQGCAASARRAALHRAAVGGDGAELHGHPGRQSCCFCSARSAAARRPDRQRRSGRWSTVALALAVISFTAVTQRNARARYRFPMPLAGRARASPTAAALRGTVDDLSDSGLRFYGELPDQLAVGDRLHRPARCCPTARCRSGARCAAWSPRRADDGAARAIGCSFSTAHRRTAPARGLPLRLRPAVGTSTATPTRCTRR